jgi:excisionase family DNA binding protein
MVEVVDKLTLKDVAKELNRSLEQVRRYVREGKLPAQKLGMQWFVERKDLDAFKGVTGKASGDDLLAELRALRESIRARHGTFDVVEMLEESRRSHP